MNLKIIFAALAIAASVGVATYFAWPQERMPLLFGTAVFESGEQLKRDQLEFIVHGNNIYIDENKDGTPQSNEKIDRGEQTPFEHSETGQTFQISQTDLGIDAALVSDSLKQKLILYSKIGSDNTHTMSGKMELSVANEARNWLRFGGPLQFLEMEKLKLEHGDEPVELKLFLGTVAKGDLQDDSAELESMSYGPDSLPLFRTTIVIPVEKAPFPRARIEFEVADSDEPVVQELVMDQFC